MATDAKIVRRYQAGIERALGLFDSTSEWADFIAYLSRLLKALQDPPPDAELPLKSVIAHHLAQCLRPSLPSGVHQKALDVYILIFTIIGQDGLARDLPLFLPGLSHTFAFASLSTRPQLLSLYDEHILKLSASTLRPAVRALILSLLPGLEEENGEDFDRTLETFNRIKQKYAACNQEEVFWQALFLASITNPNRRAGVLVYLTRFLPKLNIEPPMPSSDANNELILPDVDPVTRPEPGLLVRCFATGLQDEQPLVQRGFLDLLVTHLPLQAHIFRQTQHLADLDVLVRSATAVVLRRDMGLNRRLWSWFIGQDAKAAGSTSSVIISKVKNVSSGTSGGENQAINYFLTNGLPSVVRGIQLMLSTRSVQPVSKMRPFRIALSLMDRWEIGGPVVEATFVPLIQSLQAYQSDAPSQEAFDEVFRSANVFFDGIEGRLIAGQIINLVQQDELDLILFITSNFNLEDDEMMKRHVPFMCLCVAERLRDMISITKVNGSRDALFLQMEKLGQILVELLKMIGPELLEDNLSDRKASYPDDWKLQVLHFYQQSASTTKSTTSPLPKYLVGTIMAQNLSEIYLHALGNFANDNIMTLSLTSALELYFAITKGFVTFSHNDFCPRLLHLTRKQNQEGCLLETVVGVAKIVNSLYTYDTSQQALSKQLFGQFVPLLTIQLWDLLQPSTPQNHVEAAEILWHLHSVSVELKLVESTILSQLAGSRSNAREHQINISRFGTLWTHSKSFGRLKTPSQQPTSSTRHGEMSDLLRQPLLFLLDSTTNERVDEALATWARSLTSLDPIIHLILDAVHEDLTDQQTLGLGLRRLAHMVNIAKVAPPLWQAFCQQNGPVNAILELCSLVLSKEAFATKLGSHALSLVQSLIRGGQYQLGDHFMSFLNTQLAASYETLELQGALLETFQAIFSNPVNPQAAEVLLPTLLDGIATLNTDAESDKLIALLCSVVPLLPTTSLMANLLKITNCLCRRLYLYFCSLQDLYGVKVDALADDNTLSNHKFNNPERSIFNLLAGMEYILARAHHQASQGAEPSTTSINGTTSDVSIARSSANDQLTVILCMQDVLKSCAAIWLWRASGRNVVTAADVKSFQYISSKFRGRTRRILENLIEAEPQECLETLMGLWVERRASGAQHGQVLELLQTLDGARPKFMMPATFNAIYNRTNPAALDRSQRSSLSVNVNAFQLIAFLNDYTDALEDDLLDEIWADCTTFLREILSNPMPHRQILLKLLEFVAVLCTKMDNTNFGDESRMRKELADNCARLFTAIFTIKPNGLDGSGSNLNDAEAVLRRIGPSARGGLDAGNALRILYHTLPDLTSCLNGSDRLLPICMGIATNITSPPLHAKTFPATLSPELLALMQTMSSIPTATKAWKKDLTDALNDARFFQGPVELVEFGWLPLLRQSNLMDKTIMPELLGRLVPPATAGIMFGVGASAARTEADKRTQLTLRRTILLLLSMETDSFVPHLQTILTKLQELLTATVDSSPSLTTRSDVYLMFRGIMLSFSQSQLPAVWPMLDRELRELCNDILESAGSRYSMSAKIQGAKLIDLLLLLKPDEFQLSEWLFVTDTMDAIYPPESFDSIAYADKIGSVIPHTDSHLDNMKSTLDTSSLRKPWLCTDDSRDPDKYPGLLSSFFSQLSIRAFEDNYSLERIDMAACRKDLIADIFAET